MWKIPFFLLLIPFFVRNKMAGNTKIEQNEFRFILFKLVDKSMQKKN